MTYEEKNNKKNEMGNSYEQADLLKETQPAYHPLRAKKQGEFTIEDYFAWPEEERIELIDGVIYNMSSPVALHQGLAGLIHTSFVEYVRKKGGKCMPMMSPLDVQLDRDNKTIVQPDVMIICNRDLFQKGRIYGAPELVVEILSPSSRKKDMQIKLNKYMEAGVQEYWIVDPRDKKIIVYTNKEEEFNTTIYTFEQSVPVNMYGNECEVDFKEIYEELEFLF